MVKCWECEESWKSYVILCKLLSKDTPLYSHSSVYTGDCTVVLMNDK